MKTFSRREFFRRSTQMALTAGLLSNMGCKNARKRRPNILFAISDDQSWLHAGIYGCKAVNTPAFDRIAREGALLTNAFVAAPQCSPNRASILTGRHIWQNEEAGTHASNFPSNLTVFTDLLERADYQIGYTGKPWGPGNWEITGWTRNPAGPGFNEYKLKPPAAGINSNDYASNFTEFLNQKDPEKPFFFWYGCHEPHRSYQKGVGIESGKKVQDVEVPPFLPDTAEIRSDILDYLYEIEWFDQHLDRMIKTLEDRGDLDRTLILATSDNGMPFPRAKANLYEYGVHMPMAVRWPAVITAGQVLDSLVSFVDLAPTFLKAAGVAPPSEMTGHSFLPVMKSRSEANRNYVLFGRERHTHARPDNLAYPARAIRTKKYLYIWNIKPDRWPAGDPGLGEGFFDIDGSPSKNFVLQDESSKWFKLACAKRPEEELYNIAKDPGCVDNLADDPAHARVKEELRKKLETLLEQQGDPRVLGFGDVFESYPRYSRMRDFPGFKQQGEYNPEYQIKK